MSTRSFADARAWVSGGQRGLGLAMARALVDQGASLVITSRDPESDGVRASLSALRERAATWAAQHGKTAREVQCVAWDMADLAAADALSAAVKAAPPDILVHAAHAFSPHQPVVALKPRDFAASLTTNVAGAYALCRLVGRHMARAGFGRILLFGSLAAELGGVGQASYITEKAALTGLTRALAVELGLRGVTVNIVHPGIVDTENVRARVDGRVLEAFARRTVAERLLTADEVARSALALCDPASAAITGQSIRLSAGSDSALAFVRDAMADPEDDAP